MMFDGRRGQGKGVAQRGRDWGRGRGRGREIVEGAAFALPSLLVSWERSQSRVGLSGALLLMVIAGCGTLPTVCGAGGGGSVPKEPQVPVGGDISLWIDEQQVKEFSGFPMRIHAIADGVVLPYVLDPNFEKYLPVIPSEVTSVNFTWKAGQKRVYSYHFDQLLSSNHYLLGNPVISIQPKGKVPRKPHVFQVFLPCVGNASGVASLAIGLRIVNEQGLSLPGMPLRLRLQKQCAQHGPDPECDKKCANGGWCNSDKICECPKGYIGQYCRSALCYPQCMNGGTCIAPGVCSCAHGYQGPHCEGGICREKCVNGGKCVQKDSCACRRGHYGPRCEYSKCLIPCLNGGRCVGVNDCRCRRGHLGPQCERTSPSVGSVRKNRSRKRQRKQFV